MKLRKIGKQKLKTTTDGYYPHEHYIEIDKNGNGRTLDTLSGPTHGHEIKNFTVESDGAHIHQIPELTKKAIREYK